MKVCIKLSLLKFNRKRQAICPESGGLDIVQLDILEVPVRHRAVEHALKHRGADGEEQLVALRKQPNIMTNCLLHYNL